MAEIVVNATDAGIQHQPTIAPLGSSHFLIAWADNRDFTIKGRLVQANGTLSGGEFLVSGATDSPSNTLRQFPVIGSTGSGPVAAWIEKAINPPGPRPHVKLQRFDREGQKAGAEIQVSASDVDPDHRPALTGMIDGGFVVAWLDARPDRRIRAQRFSPEGVKEGPEIAINSSEGFHEAPTATRLVDGNYVIAWRGDPSPPGGGALMYRIFDLEGTPTVDETRPNLSGFRGEKGLSFLDDGRFVIVHVRRTGVSDIGVDQSEVEAHVVDPTGGSAVVPIGVGGDRHQNVAFPAVSALPGARFLAAWVEKSAETFATTPTVRARVFSGAGESVGPEVTVSGTGPGARSGTCVATDFTGDSRSPVCLVWVQDSTSGGGPLNRDISGRVMSAADTGLVDG